MSICRLLTEFNWSMFLYRCSVCMLQTKMKVILVCVVAFSCYLFSTYYIFTNFLLFFVPICNSLLVNSKNNVQRQSENRLEGLQVCLLGKNPYIVFRQRNCMWERKKDKDQVKNYLYTHKFYFCISYCMLQCTPIWVNQNAYYARMVVLRLKEDITNCIIIRSTVVVY